MGYKKISSPINLLYHISTFLSIPTENVVKLFQCIQYGVENMRTYTQEKSKRSLTVLYPVNRLQIQDSRTEGRRIRLEGCGFMRHVQID